MNRKSKISKKFLSWLPHSACTKSSCKSSEESRFFFLQGAEKLLSLSWFRQTFTGTYSFKVMNFAILRFSRVSLPWLPMSYSFNVYLSSVFHFSPTVRPSRRFRLQPSLSCMDTFGVRLGRVSRSVYSVAPNDERNSFLSRLLYSVRRRDWQSIHLPTSRLQPSFHPYLSLPPPNSRGFPVYSPARFHHHLSAASPRTR